MNQGVSDERNAALLRVSDGTRKAQGSMRCSWCTSNNWLAPWQSCMTAGCEFSHESNPGKLFRNGLVQGPGRPFVFRRPRAQHTEVAVFFSNRPFLSWSSRGRALHSLCSTAFDMCY